jgi:hypothetical protein
VTIKKKMNGVSDNKEEDEWGKELKWEWEHETT